MPLGEKIDKKFIPAENVEKTDLIEANQVLTNIVEEFGYTEVGLLEDLSLSADELKQCYINPNREFSPGRIRYFKAINKADQMETKLLIVPKRTGDRIDFAFDLFSSSGHTGNHDALDCELRNTLNHVFGFPSSLEKD